MEQDICQRHGYPKCPDSTTDPETSNLPPAHQEPSNQSLAHQSPQTSLNSQYGYTPSLTNTWPFPCGEEPWAPQSMAWDTAASQPPTTEPAMATSSQDITALYDQAGLGDTCDPQGVPLWIRPEQSYDLLASLGLGVDWAVAALPSQSDITPLMPSFAGWDETTAFSTRNESTAAEGPSQEGYAGTSGAEEGIVGAQKHIDGAVEELCQLEGRLRYLNKQQMSLVEDSLNNHTDA